MDYTPFGSSAVRPPWPYLGACIVSRAAELRRDPAAPGRNDQRAARRPRRRHLGQISPQAPGPCHGPAPRQY
eukprot:6864186-Pyramimonas_sp.AAC.1